MKVFRNVLVHIYDKLIDQLVYENIVKNLNDFDIIKEEVINILKTKSEKPNFQKEDKKFPLSANFSLFNLFK